MQEVQTIPGVWWFFEILIYFFLVGCGILILELSTKMKKPGFLKSRLGFLFVFSVISWIVVFYGSFVAPKILNVVEYDVDLDVLGYEGEFRAVVVSDIHVGPYKDERWVSHLVDEINLIDADVVFMVGDFIFGDTEEILMMAPVVELNKPVYAVLGNHDEGFGDAVVISDRLREYGVVVLENESVDLRLKNGEDIDLVGVGDIWFSGNTVAAMEGIDSVKPVVLLGHNPDVILDDGLEGVDLILSGHTHGGQIRLPVIGPVPPLPTVLGRKWDVGFRALDGDRDLFITTGVGETGPRARLFNTPEISVLNIKY